MGGPFGNGGIGKPRLKATHVKPCYAQEERPRRDGLLRRLLKSEVDGYYSAILQCVRYIVATDFFRKERPALPGAASSCTQGRALPNQQTDDALLEEDFDDAQLGEASKAP